MLYSILGGGEANGWVVFFLFLFSINKIFCSVGRKIIV